MDYNISGWEVGQLIVQTVCWRYVVWSLIEINVDFLNPTFNAINVNGATI